ncbi:aquaporin-like protein [Auriscalpium vulgare]|uniref:Aquaporin-like protein n=1 Tax=Auriscalpium vulgare TaxID=40419 RepID=A0ACB8S2K0_9AGAM|nr:aquaporin-like protein [Auriscalpium vulgare]
MYRLSPSVTGDVQAALLEFVGTTVFLLLGLGGIQASGRELLTTPNTASDITRVLYISTSMGLSLLVSAWLFFRVTGGLFNPNISLALLLVGVINPVRFVLYTIAQLSGAIAASALIIALTPGPLAVNTVLGPNVNKAQGVFIEMFITAALVLAVLMLAAEKHNTTPFAPIGIGLTLFACHLFAVYYTGAAMNTARAFGPAAVTGFRYSGQWIYWLGPYLGSILAAAFYTVIKHYEYWTLVPGQESTEPTESPPDPAAALTPSSRRSEDPDMAQRGDAGSGQMGVNVPRREKSINSPV